MSYENRTTFLIAGKYYIIQCTTYQRLPDVPKLTLSRLSIRQQIPHTYLKHTSSFNEFELYNEINHIVVIYLL